MPASMRDVARLAGVSQRTVSNVVNDYVHVRPETRERVQQAIATLRYRPNISARKLRQGRTGLLALAVPEIAAPYFAELADKLQRQAQARGATLLIDQTGATRDHELLVLEGYRSNTIDGVILSAEGITAEDLEYRDFGFPMVLLGESIDNSGFLHVSIDNIAAARVATEHLLGLGRRRIAAIGADLYVSTSGPASRRMRGYVAALSAAGVPVRPDLTFDTSGWTRAEGYAIARRIVAGYPEVDALFCFNDTLALGALKAFHELGVRVPEDIAVVGWDNIDDASYSIPTLTTIAPDTETIAERAVAGLLAAPDAAPVDHDELTCSFELKVRDSTRNDHAPR